jgi:hypothetical protein
MKLSVIAVLTGTLALVGCGDDSTNGTGGMGGGTGGTGGTGGGTGGTGGGTGGTGGGEACEQTCGVGNETPDWATDVQVLACNVMGIGIDLEFSLQGQVQGTIMADADNTYDLSSQTIIPAATANLILALAESADILSATATVSPTAGTTDTNTLDITLNDTPCTVCFEANTANSVQLPQFSDTWNLDDGATQELTAQDVVIEIDSSGLVLTLGTTGDDPACAWDTVPPSLSFSLPM